MPGSRTGGRRVRAAEHDGFVGLDHDTNAEDSNQGSGLSVSILIIAPP